MTLFLNLIMRLILCLYTFVNLQSYAADQITISQFDFNLFVQRKMPGGKFEWIMPEQISASVPADAQWVNEGEGGYYSAENEDTVIHLATQGIITCTGLSAFTQTGSVALAHISDMAPSKVAALFLETINVDISKPITLVARCLSEPVIENYNIIRQCFPETPIFVRTLPIYTNYYYGITRTVFRKTIRQVFLKFDCINYSFRQDGKISFFSLSPEQETKIRTGNAQRNPRSFSYENLYVTDFSQLELPSVLMLPQSEEDDDSEYFEE